jgi:hypothetical protein
MAFKRYDFDPRNLPQALLTAIGLMTASAAQTEGIVEWAIAGCLGVDAEFGMAVTTHMNAPLRDSVLRSVAEIRIDDLDALDELDNLLEEINQAYVKRNAVVHHTWCRDPETGAIFTVKETARTRVESDLLPMSVDQVKSDALFVYDAGMKLMGFLMTHELAPASPPVRPRGHKSKVARKKRREAMLKRGGA